MVERIGSGAIAEVFKGYWHGEVAVKRFLLPDATPNQIMKFKEEVSHTHIVQTLYCVGCCVEENKT